MGALKKNVKEENIKKQLLGRLNNVLVVKRKYLKKSMEQVRLEQMALEEVSVKTVEKPTTVLLRAG